MILYARRYLLEEDKNIYSELKEDDYETSFYEPNLDYLKQLTERIRRLMKEQLSWNIV